MNKDTRQFEGDLKFDKETWRIKPFEHFKNFSKHFESSKSFEILTKNIVNESKHFETLEASI